MLIYRVRRKDVRPRFPFRFSLKKLSALIIMYPYLSVIQIMKFRLSFKRDASTLRFSVPSISETLFEVLLTLSEELNPL